MRTVIGVIPLYDDEKESYWMLPGYMKVIEKLGALPIMLPLTNDKDELDDAFSLCDGLLFTGGHDVSPSEYGEEKKESCGMTCKLRDEMEGYLLDKAIAENKAFLGICRGIQFINAHLGGSLYQDIPTELESNIEHHMTKPYDQEIHEVMVCENTILSEIIGAGLHGVNSYHHQGIKTLAKGLSKMAVASDGLIEAVSVDGNKFGIGVQWHPEFSYESSEDSIKLVEAFLFAAGKAG